MKKVALGLIAGIALTIGGHALAFVPSNAAGQTNVSQAQLFSTTGNANTSINYGEVYKFQDKNVTCYTYTKGGISCVK